MNYICWIIFTDHLIFYLFIYMRLKSVFFSLLKRKQLLKFVIETLTRKTVHIP